MCHKELPGDTWTIRHDSVKFSIKRECLKSKLPCDVEVYGVFADQLPAVEVQEGGQLYYARARQGLVPDFRLRLPTPVGPTDCLAELKVIGAGVTWHPVGRKGTGVERRAQGLPAYYKRELRKFDVRYHGTGPGETGPLVARLQSYGKLECLVAGPWGNGSKDLHSLVTTMAECRVAARARATGQASSDHELGLVTGQIRRALSGDMVRAQALCLISRLCHLGEGAKEAAQRRQVTAREV
jgi:hypothetical protein